MAFLVSFSRAGSDAGMAVATAVPRSPFPEVDVEVSSLMADESLPREQAKCEPRKMIYSTQPDLANVAFCVNLAVCGGDGRFWL